MKLRWQEGELVECDLQDISRRIRRGNPEAALRFLRAVYTTFNLIAENPEIGRLRPDAEMPDVRSWHVRGFRRYLILYSTEPTCVLIHRVVHGSRNLGSELIES